MGCKTKNGKQEIISIAWIMIFFVFLTLQMCSLPSVAYWCQLLFFVATPVAAYMVKDNTKVARQMFIIDLYFGLLWFFGILNGLSHKNRKELILGGAVAFLIAAILLLKGTFLEFRKYKLSEVFKKYLGVIVVSMIFFIFTFETIFEIPWHDAEVYYGWNIKNLSYYFDFSFCDIEHYTLALHPSLGYAMIVLLAELISSQSTVVLHTFNIVLAIISAFCLFRVLDYVFPTKNKYVKTACTGIYLFSPWLLGFIGFINIDTPSIYFFVILLSCFIYKNRLLEIVMAYLFVFTKEPSIVYYAFFLLGIIIYEYLIDTERKTDHQIEGFFLSIFSTFKKLISEILIGFIWLISFLGRFSVSWGQAVDVFHLSEDSNEVHCFGFTIANLLAKIKGVLILNFNWIFVVLIVVNIILLLVRRKSEKVKLPLERLFYRCVVYSTFVGFTLFNLFYIDLEHPRYNAIGAVLFILIGIDILLAWKNEKVTAILSTIVALLLLVQSMVTIDPVSYVVFDKVTDYGDNMMISPFKGRHGVLGFYNREYSYYYKAIEKVLIECGYDGDEDIILEGLPTPFGPMFDYWWNGNRMIPSDYNRDDVIMMNFVFGVYGPLYDRKIVILPYSAETKEGYGEVTYRTVSLKYYVIESNNL